MEHAPKVHRGPGKGAARRAAAAAAAAAGSPKPGGLARRAEPGATAGGGIKRPRPESGAGAASDASAKRPKAPAAASGASARRPPASEDASVKRPAASDASAKLPAASDASAKWPAASDTSSKRPAASNASANRPAAHAYAPAMAGKRPATLLDKFKAKLDGGQFRWLNEQLYTTTSESAEQLFTKDPSLYWIYHRGFESQVSKWPENPAHVIAEMVGKMPPGTVCGDFGCGNAHIARTVRQKVYSFDLRKTNEWVTVANSASVPLQDASLDVAIFCLGLMGTDFESFLVEARRVLKRGGKLIIAEVKSRFAGEAAPARDRDRQGDDQHLDARRTEQSMLGGIASFIARLAELGFALELKDTTNTMFALFALSKQHLEPAAEKALRRREPQPHETLLKSCKYKKR
jgi:ribosomal RNA-processing protein 8